MEYKQEERMFIYCFAEDKLMINGTTKDALEILFNCCLGRDCDASGMEPASTNRTLDPSLVAPSARTLRPITIPICLPLSFGQD